MNVAQAILLCRLAQRFPLPLPESASPQARELSRGGDDPRGVSMHEAGHALLAWRLGWPFRSVSIGRAGDGNIGRVDLQWPSDKAARPLVEIEEMAIRSAGPIATHLYRGNSGLDWDRGHKDYFIMREGRLLDRPANDLLRAEAIARRELAVNWRAVCALADALLDAGVLGGERACEILAWS